MEKDFRSGSYNPLLYRFHLQTGTLTDEARQELSHTLDSSIRTMAATFELWDFGAYHAVIESTVYHGLYAVGTSVLQGTFRHRRRSLRKKEKQPYA